MAPRIRLSEVGAPAGEDRRDDRQPRDLRPEPFGDGQVVDVDHMTSKPSDPHGGTSSIADYSHCE